MVIMVRRLEKGATLREDLTPEGKADFKATITLEFTILEGHRLCIQDILAGQALTSWNYPFGYAITDIKKGSYVCNHAMLKSLQERKLTFDLPSQHNFSDRIVRYVVDEKNFQPGRTEPRGVDEPDLFFQGFPRRGGQGVGTRNPIVIFGVTSTSAGFCRKLADQARLSFDPRMFPNIDSVTSVAHTEGNRVDELPNTYARLVRCLCGMMVNPNVGALLIVDVPSGAGTQGISNANIIQFFDSNPEHKRRLASIPHQFFSLTGDFLADLQSGMEIVTDWLPIVNQFYRVKCPISELKVFVLFLHKFIFSME